MAEALAAPSTPGGEWSRGWRTVASGGVGMVFVSGVSAVTGVVMVPLEQAFGWSRTLVAANVMICAVLTLLLAPVVGQAITRHGVRRCAITGTLAAIPALALIAFNPGSAVWWIASWIVFGIINTLLGPLLWSTAVTQLFDKSRGLALAIMLSGSGLAFAIFPPFALFVLELADWRGVYIAFAVLFGIVLLPFVLVWFRGHSEGAGALGRAPAAKGAPAAAATGSASSLGEALRGRHFWQLALLCLLVAAVEGAMAIHLFPILVEGGMTPVGAAGAASTMGGALVVGRLSTGFLQDRFPARWVFVLAITALLVSAAIVLVFTGGQAEGVAIAALLGFGAGGTINSLAYLVGRYFALSAYASIFGLLMGIFAVGYGVAPMVAAYARDLVGGYQPLVPTFLAMLAIGALLAATMGREKAGIAA